MLNLSRQIFWWFTTLLPKSADHIDERHLARLPLASLLSFSSNRSYTCQLANRHLMLYGFSIFPNSERGHAWKQPNVKACSLRTVWEVYGYSMVFIENQYREVQSDHSFRFAQLGLLVTGNKKTFALISLIKSFCLKKRYNSLARRHQLKWGGWLSCG